MYLHRAPTWNILDTLKDQGKASQSGWGGSGGEGSDGRGRKVNDITQGIFPTEQWVALGMIILIYSTENTETHIHTYNYIVLNFPGAILNLLHTQTPSTSQSNPKK